MLFDAQDGSQSSSSLSSFRSEQEHIGSSSTQSRSRYLSPDHHWLIKDYNGYINDSPDDHWERGCCKQLCKRTLYHWEGANRGEYFHMFIFAYLHIWIFAYWEESQRGSFCRWLLIDESFPSWRRGWFFLCRSRSTGSEGWRTRRKGSRFAKDFSKNFNFLPFFRVSWSFTHLVEEQVIFLKILVFMILIVFKQSWS